MLWGKQLEGRCVGDHSGELAWGPGVGRQGAESMATQLRRPMDTSGSQQVSIYLMRKRGCTLQAPRGKLGMHGGPGEETLLQGACREVCGSQH